MALGQAGSLAGPKTALLPTPRAACNVLHKVPQVPGQFLSSRLNAEPFPWRRRGPQVLPPNYFRVMQGASSLPKLMGTSSSPKCTTAPPAFSHQMLLFGRGPACRGGCVIPCLRGSAPLGMLWVHRPVTGCSGSCSNTHPMAPGSPCVRCPPWVHLP